MLAVILIVVWRAWPVVEALVIAGVLAGALWPWISRISSARVAPGWRLPRWVAVALVYLATFGGLAAMVWIGVIGLLPTLDRIVADHPGATAELRRWMDAVRAPTVEEGARRVVEEATTPTDPSGAALGVVGGAMTSGLVLLLTFMLLVSGDTIAGWLFMLLPRQDRADARALAMRIRDRMSNWVLGWLAYGLVNGAIVLVATAALGVASPWTYAIVAVALALLPGMGPALVYVPAILLSVDDGWRVIGLVAAASIQHLLDVFVLAPRILAAELKVPPVVTIVAVLVGAALFGFWGALIATPVTVAVQQLLRERLRPAQLAAAPPEAG